MACVSGLLEALKDKPRILIRADRGFAVKDMQEKLKIELNISPLLEGQRQLPPNDIQSGRKIAVVTWLRSSSEHGANYMYALTWSSTRSQ